MSSGRIWPYAIGASIIFIFGACVATIVVANRLPVQKSDTYMMDYHEADAKANEILQAAIAFNKEYKIEYVTQELSSKKSVIMYKVTDKNQNPVDNAQIKVVITRPNKHVYDQELTDPRIDNGVYFFEIASLPQEGRWDIMAKVKIGAYERFYNVKADTRAKEFIEY